MTESNTGRGAAERFIAQALGDDAPDHLQGADERDEDVEATHADEQETEGKWNRYKGN